MARRIPGFHVPPIRDVSHFWPAFACLCLAVGCRLFSLRLSLSVFRCWLFRLIGLVSVLLLFSCADSPLHYNAFESYVLVNTEKDENCKCIEKKKIVREARTRTMGKRKSIRCGKLRCCSLIPLVATNATISMCRLKSLTMWLPLFDHQFFRFSFGFGVDVWLRAFNDDFIWE